MANPVVRRVTVRKDTTDTTVTTVWTAPYTPLAAIVHVIAFDTTSLAQGDSKRWSFSVSGMVGSEGSPQRVDSTDMYTPAGDTGASAWGLEVQDNGSDRVEINIIGEASTDITWTLLVEHWDPTA